MNRSQIRKEVMAEIIRTYKAAEDRGEDAWRTVERAYPGIPSDVVAEAMMAGRSNYRGVVAVARAHYQRRDHPQRTAEDIIGEKVK